MSHDEAGELLGAYALDAVDGDELTALEVHLATCPRCRAELDGLHEVAAAMGNSVEPLPDGLWSSIASRLPERPGDEEPPPMPRLTPEGRSPFRPPPDRRQRRRRSAVTTLGALAVAAAAVAVVLGIGLVRADNRVSGLQAAASAHQGSPVAAALHTPGHRLVELDTPSHAQLAQFVVVPDGRGYLVSSQLPGCEPTRPTSCGGSWTAGRSPSAFSAMRRARLCSPWPVRTGRRVSASRPSRPGVR